MGLSAADIMTTTVITVGPKTGVRELAEILTLNKISGAPVVDENDQLIGVVSQSDLVAQNKKLHIPTAITLFDWVIYLEGTERLESEINKITGAVVGDIMTRKVMTVKPDTPLEEVATLMSEKKVHTLPVVKDGRLIGVIGKLDIVKSFLQ